MPDRTVIIRVELRGDPDWDVYDKLNGLMRENNWDTVLTSDDGTVVNLPHAVYAGSTEDALLELSNGLRDNINESIWDEGCIVLVVECAEWAQSD